MPPATVASVFSSSPSPSPPPLLPPLIHPPSTGSPPAAAASHSNPPAHAASLSPPPAQPAQPQQPPQAQPTLPFQPQYAPPAAPFRLQKQSAPVANAFAAAPPQPAPASEGGGSATAALLAQYNVARRLLHAWPDTVHQFERESGVCFDLQHFASLLQSGDYSAASDYLVSFWIHPLYRTTLSRAEHCQVRHSLVNAMKLKLTLLCMTSDRLSLDYFVEKELRPKMLALSLSLLDVETLVRKAYCDVRVRFTVPVNWLRNTVWYDLGGTQQSQQQRLREQQLLQHFLSEPSVSAAHVQLLQQVRSLPFHFAPYQQQAGQGAAAAAGAQQAQTGGDERKADEYEREAKEESRSVSSAPVLPPIDYSSAAPPDRHRKRHHSEERREREGGRGERRRHKRRATTDAIREVIDLDSDSDRTASDVEQGASPAHSFPYSQQPPAVPASRSAAVTRGASACPCLRSRAAAPRRRRRTHRTRSRCHHSSTCSARACPWPSSRRRLRTARTRRSASGRMWKTSRPRRRRPTPRASRSCSRRTRRSRHPSRQQTSRRKSSSSRRLWKRRSRRALASRTPTGRQSTDRLSGKRRLIHSPRRRPARRVAARSRQTSLPPP